MRLSGTESLAASATALYASARDRKPGGFRYGALCVCPGPKAWRLPLQSCERVQMVSGVVELHDLRQRAPGTLKLDD